MPWKHFEVLLTPRLIVLQRTSISRWRHGGIRSVPEAVEHVENDTDWRTAVAALEKMLASETRQIKRVEIVLSDLWVRSHLMPVASSGLNEDEMMLLARTQFARQYPEAAQDNWTFRLAPQGTHLLVAGIESELLEALNGINSKAGGQLKLLRVEPLFAWLYNRYEMVLADAHGWMLLDEPGMITVAFVERGSLMSLHCQRCEANQEEIAVRLLERQSVMIAQQSVEVRIFSVGARAIHLPEPWRIASHQRVFDTDDTVALTRSHAPIARPH